MEVPFLSSGAISRSHYNLVQKVEAALPQDADDILQQEVEELQLRFEKRRPTSAECVESLVLLLYCLTATLGRVTRAMLQFAVPHAVTLAEAGSTINQKRIGYLFCNEIMDIDDELQIMLVNTLRKDLEDPKVARICLALDALITNCPADAVPAVTPRLIDLLAHDSPHVKRKTMTVIRRISVYNQDVLRHAKVKVTLRLKDSDFGVLTAALRLLGTLTRAHVLSPEESLNLALDGYTRNTSESNQASERGLKKALAELVGGLANEVHATEESLVATRATETLHKMLTTVKDEDAALILEIFCALSSYKPEILRPHFSSSGATAMSVLRRLVTSPRPNIQYLCLVCLLSLDPILWAGTTDLIAPAFNEGQVHAIMGLLDSQDSVIRKNTLQVLYRVDPQIPSIHLSQLQSAFELSSRQERDRIAERVLEVAMYLDTDGGAYSSRIKELSIGLESRTRHDEKGKGRTTGSGAGLVSEKIVEQVLLHLRTRSVEFCRAFVDTAARIPVSDAGPTLTLVIAAAICEYGSSSSIAQEDLLRGLSNRLNANPPAIQEALLLAMLRVTARCDVILSDVTEQVRELHAISGTHIRRRCDQYLSFSENLTSLKNIASNSQTDTLPDFLYALETVETDPRSSPPTRHRSATNASRSSVAAGKLRYDAYDPPRPAPKLIRRPSSTTSVNSHAASSRSSRSDSISSHSQPQRTGETDDILSRTVTAGDLALAAHETTFEVPIRTISPEGNPQTAHHTHPIEDLIMKTDLIALDSPFLDDPNEEPEQHVSPDFYSTWDVFKSSTTSRGWCEISPERAKQRLEALPNYHITIIQTDEGKGNKEELLLLVTRGASNRREYPEAALRLLRGEDESTLWQLRCVDHKIRGELRKLLDDT